MKRIIKKFIPKRIWSFLSKIRVSWKYLPYFFYDFRRFAKFSNAVYQFDNEQKILGTISTYTHIIEKGLILSGMRKGFGIPMINALIDLCDKYAKEFGTGNSRFIAGVSTIKEYHELHSKANFIFDNEIKSKLDNFVETHKDIATSSQQVMNAKDYFKDNINSFDKFAFSRHSLRAFSGSVKLSLIKNAISLAGNAPSACNKQDTRVYVIEKKEIINNILCIINGGRGFAEQADKFLVITSELGAWGNFTEKNAGYFDAGIYTMNLLYALHFYKIGACVLNTYFTPKQDLLFREKTGVKESENIMCVIAIGGVPNDFTVTLSNRIPIETIINVL